MLTADIGQQTSFASHESRLPVDHRDPSSENDMTDEEGTVVSSDMLRHGTSSSGKPILSITLCRYVMNAFFRSFVLHLMTSFTSLHDYVDISFIFSFFHMQTIRLPLPLIPLIPKSTH